MSLEKTHYDVAILCTSLPQSILSAALSAAGLSVIHLDKNDYYADQWASLSLSELQRWANANGSRQVVDVKLSFPASVDPSPDSLPSELRSLDRHYAISLAPTLLPAIGPSIDALIASKVSAYATFRLLEHTAVFSPGSTSTSSTSSSSSAKISRVPASKEDIFKTKSLSLVEKRKLMKLLLHLASDEWDRELNADASMARRPFVEYLSEVHKLPPSLTDAIAYGVSLCATPRESTREAMKRARLHMKSMGRYGNAAYLVGQYGGAGELAQGYCRASAVRGSTFILDHDLSSVKREGSTWHISVDGIEQKVTADYLVCSDEMLEQLELAPTSNPDRLRPCSSTHRCVLVLDRPIDFLAAIAERPTRSSNSNQDPEVAEEASSLGREETLTPPETGLLVFPPNSVASNTNAVMVLMMGEGTFSCPKGQYVYYVQTEAEDGVSTATHVVLQPFVEAILALAGANPPGGDPSSSQPVIRPLVQLSYLQKNSSASPRFSSEAHLSAIPFPPTTTTLDDGDLAPVASMTAMTDSAVTVAEDIYYTILASRLPETLGDYEQRLAWVQAARIAKKNKRARRREEAEYQGRGGRGVDDGVTKDIDEGANDGGNNILDEDFITFFEATQEPEEAG